MSTSQVTGEVVVPFWTIIPTSECTGGEGEFMETEQDVIDWLKKAYPKCKFMKCTEYMHGTVVVLKRRRKKHLGTIDVIFRRRGL
jgi:hypothetical protein